MPSLGQIIQTVNRSTFKLDLSGIVGLLGGDTAVKALETIHLYNYRRLAGWYNYPGIVAVAKRFGQMADSRLWDSIFPGPNETPTVTFNLTGKFGPDYRGVYSGTRLRTGYLGYLAAEECVNFPSNPFRSLVDDGRVTGSSAAVTIISLPPRQHERVLRDWIPTEVTVAGKKYGLIPIKPKSSPPFALWAIVPLLVSILACVLCIIGHDHLCASLIILGILSGGFSSFVLGSATLSIRVPPPSLTSSTGDGLMFPADGSIIILKGMETDVNIITKGEFELSYPTWVHSHGKYHAIGISSLLLVLQALVQFLLLPRCTFFGQILTVLSFLTSGIYHLCVASHEREMVQREILRLELSMQLDKWTLRTRTQMAVFVCLILGGGRSKYNPDTVLGCIIPNETVVWRYWRRKVVKELERYWNWDSESLDHYVPSIQAEPEATEMDDYLQLTSQDAKLLNTLIRDVQHIFSGFPKWQATKDGPTFQNNVSV